MFLHVNTFLRPPIFDLSLLFQGIQTPRWSIVVRMFTQALVRLKKCTNLNWSISNIKASLFHMHGYGFYK